ncbi:hypothetical protein TraAM80_10378, partial [Trypanosoma rangeli]
MVAGEAGTRALSAMRTVVQWMALLLLLQYVGSHPSFTAAGEDEHVRVKIKKYFSFPHSEFIIYDSQVTYDLSLRICILGGGLLTADQTPAAHESITDYMRQVGDVANGEVFTYMGGDTIYSVHREKDPDKICRPGVAEASLNCIFEWNLGEFEHPEETYRGAQFFRGSLHSLTGAGRMNGYESYWEHHYPAHGEMFLISHLDLRKNTTATWYDGSDYA